MREKKPQLVVTFHTTAAAMSMEKLCAQAGIPGRLFPAPRELTADCGIAWRSAPETAQQVRALAESRQLAVEGYAEILI